MHKCYFTVSIRRNGYVEYRQKHLSLLQALWYFYRQVRKRGKYGTMHFELEGD